MTTMNLLPPLSTATFDGMTKWFSALAAEDLLFHPDDDPASIFRIRDGVATFSPDQVADLNRTLEMLFEEHGDRVYEAALPNFAAALGIAH